MNKIKIDGTDIEILYSQMVSSNMQQIGEMLSEVREEIEEIVGDIDESGILLTDHPIAGLYEKTMSKLRNISNMAHGVKKDAKLQTELEKEKGN